MDALPEYSQASLKRLIVDNEYFAASCLKMKTDRGIEPLIYNQVQKYLNYRAEDQLRRTGKVRQVGVKGRQQTFSEFVAQRGFKYAVQNRGKTVYILSHEAASTAVLFGKVERYYKYCPDFIKPGLLASNRNQMKFDNESDYTVGTAGSENTGRSNTIQFGHLSEPGQYLTDEGVKSGLLQAISDAPGTEIWWESTARGKNWFYHFVMRVQAGLTEYELIFIPWCWSDKYRADAPSDFVRTDEEVEIAKLGTYWNDDLKEILPREIDDAQLQWRRTKIAVMGEKLFKQEYPLFLDEAFQASGDQFHDSMLIEKARRCDVTAESVSPLILGVDPGRSGDRTILTFRQGREIFPIIKYTDMDTMRLVGIVAQLIETRHPDMVFIDWGMGHGTIDRLWELGYQNVVQGVNFGGAADDPLYMNKRAEMGHRFDAWLKEGPTNLPDDDDMAADYASIPSPEITSGGKLKFPSKDEIRKTAGRSPDIWDSTVLTFAYLVRKKGESGSNAYGQGAPVKISSELTTQQRRREMFGENPNDGGKLNVVVVKRFT